MRTCMRDSRSESTNSTCSCVGVTSSTDTVEFMGEIGSCTPSSASERVVVRRDDDDADDDEEEEEDDDDTAKVKRWGGWRAVGSEVREEEREWEVGRELMDKPRERGVGWLFMLKLSSSCIFCMYM